MKIYELEYPYKNFADEFHKWAVQKHRDTGCTYSGYDYSLHLDAVRNVARQYLYLIPSEFHCAVLCASSGHDLTEDARINHGDIVKHFTLPWLSGYPDIMDQGVFVADVIYNVTNELGKNRVERSQKTYPKIASCQYSTFVKLADRVANCKFSYFMNDEKGMFKKYKSEHADFYKALHNVAHGFEEMWSELQSLMLR